MCYIKAKMHTLRYISIRISISSVTMVLLVLLLGAVLVDSGFCRNRQLLEKMPQPMSHFDEHKALGKWYFFAQLPQCSWKNSGKFTDIFQTLEHDSDGLYSWDNWKSNKVDIRMRTAQKRRESRGKYRVVDGIGGLFSEDLRYVAGDYKCYLVSWGCSKPTPEGTCDDYGVYVKTRKRMPTPTTIKDIQRSLQQLFELDLTDMIRVQHGSDHGNARYTPRDGPAPSTPWSSELQTRDRSAPSAPWSSEIQTADDATRRFWEPESAPAPKPASSFHRVQSKERAPAPRPAPSFRRVKSNLRKKY